jgi:chromosomal replication initiation ATPase DnaA
MNAGGRPIEDIRQDLANSGLYDLASACAREFNVTLAAMLGPSRFKAECRARSLFWAALYARGDWSYPEIGRLVGRDHTTVMDAVKGVSRETVEEVERLSLVRTKSDEILAMRY